MSGSCDRCGDHCLDCNCEPFLGRNKTERGFIWYSGDDLYGRQFDVQESSLASEACIWIGRHGERGHLNQSQVADLIPLLEHFVETGRLP